MSDPYEPIMRKECEQEKQDLIEEFILDLNNLNNKHLGIKNWELIKKWEERK